MSNVAIVIPWFGRTLKGGAELHAWNLAARLASRGRNVEVITTCCRSHADDWETNHYPMGAIRESEGFIVRRFSVEPRSKAAFDRVNARILAIEHARLVPGVSPVSADDENVFVNELIKCPTLLAYLEEHKQRFDAVFLLPYLYGPVIAGVHRVADRAILQPCLHDEAYAYLPSVARSIFAAQRLLFLSEGEQLLATRLFGPGIISKSMVAGAGVEIDSDDNIDDSVVSKIQGGRYVLCLGRKDPGKKTDFLVRCFENYRRRNSDSRLSLVLAGPGKVDLPLNCPGLFEFGVVSNAQKRSLLQNCAALFHPSDNESYSRVIMEAWLCGRPTAASTNCLATSSAVAKGGGWVAATKEEWISLFATVDAATETELAALGESGRQYAGEVASWDSAIGRYEYAIDEVRRAVGREESEAPDHSKIPIHQVLPNIAFGDAISNHTLWIQKELREDKHPSEVFALGIDPKAGGHVRPFVDSCIQPGDAILYHHSIGSAVTPAVVAHRGPKCLIYHNITPHQFLDPYLPLHGRLCREGRAELPKLASSFALSVGDSNFNAIELAEAGFRNPGVLPICVNPEKWAVCPDQTIVERLHDGCTNILFVGRLSPNKKQEDLIFAFSKLREFDKNTRLILVGTPVTTDDLYLACLKQLCEELGVADSVEFSGHVTDAQLAAYYRSADLFWSMSEHEGFCVPLIEAMWFDIPVFAFAGTAVPETMGNAGELFHDKSDFLVLAKRALQLARDPALRHAVISSQQRRRTEFLPAAVGRRLRQVISHLLPPQPRTSVEAKYTIQTKTIHRIAVVKLDHIGDLLLASPVFTSLRRRFPLAEITAVVAPHSAQVLHNHPDITTILTYDPAWFWRRIPTPTALSKINEKNAESQRRLLSAHFDLVVNLRSDLSNLLFAASIPHTHLLSYTNDSPYPFLATHSITRTRGMHICDQHRTLLAEIGANQWSVPRMYPSEDVYEAVNAVQQILPGTVAVFLGAGIPLKRWSPVKFRELIRRMRLRGLSVTIVGSDDDRELAASIAEETGAQNVCGLLNLLELYVFLSRCSALITNDSAPMHIGAAAGTTVVYITRPNTALEFAPVGSDHVRCCADKCEQPCEGFDANKRGELVDFCACIQSISVDEVEDKLWAILGRTEVHQPESRQALS